MQLEHKKSVSCQVAKSALAGFLIVLLLGYSALAASPSLHELIHHDAGSADHNCFITLYAKGHITPVAAVEFLALIAVLFGAVALLADQFVPSSTDYCFSASRAPPVRF
ncbi:MAG TPA: hypothetical protein VK731_01795 [Candidatus Cybelea sp.]|nr:hypothetical protein [Candidatus Cybelea sp.]